MREVELFGETFAVTDDIGDVEFAFLEFQEAAVDTAADSAAGGAAVMGVLRACLADDKDWARFKAVCRKNKARVERDLMPLLVSVMEGVAERPTQRPSVSTDGPDTTAQKSTALFSTPAISLVPEGRPDLALIVEQAQASRAS